VNWEHPKEEITARWVPVGNRRGYLIERQMSHHHRGVHYRLSHHDEVIGQYDDLEGAKMAAEFHCQGKEPVT
jgi:hypothetical protein